MRLSAATRALAILMASPLLASAASATRDDFAPFDPAKYSQSVTECDRLAAHPEDPYRVASGRTREEVLTVADQAIAACERAVADDPGNPRLRYQLARVYGYSGRGEKALPHRQAAVDADYPQALFVVGYLYLTGLNENPRDACRAGELIRESARQGRLAGQVGFVHYALQGWFDDCAVPVKDDEMLDFLAAARKQAGGNYYQGLLIELLEEGIRDR